MTKTEVAESAETTSVNDHQSFEDACIDLLCRQEKPLSLLGEKSSSACDDEALELAWQMLIQFLDFAEVHFEKEEFDKIAGDLHHVHEQTKEHQRRLGVRSWRLFRRFLKLETPTDSAMSDTYQQLGKDYAGLYRSFFDVCADRFPEGSPARERFMQSVELFLAELEAKW
jgi:hypothetical protein